ncbi:lipid-A-disaccharide synthase [Aureliella helgolandensis]|uniref:lipid-A-disaccharide synthase n=1 Tax=Aureliella helgolandensis TaxID=2527968 RepID=UPI001E34CCF0|nr:lipid-A-disaccharide synthase [Aureliella helgolandensis]
MSQPNIFFSVGEPSGDLHAAKLIEQLQRFCPTSTHRGFGGSLMEQAGCQIDFDLTTMAVVGFVEVLPKLREFFRVADIATDIFREQHPDAVVLVDFPGFNWHIAKRAKQLGIPTFYYLPPQLWAWGAWRLKKMRRYVDHVLCNLPFEQQWYSERGMEVDYVGHPFFDEVAERPLDERFLSTWQDYEGVQVAVLPGSRSREVKHIWPMQLSAIRELSRRYPKTRFMVACLRDQHCLQCKQQLTESDRGINIDFFVQRTSEIIELADCALMKSGSVSLEMMARGTPAVVVYHASRVLYGIGRCLTDIQSMTLPNMIAEKTIMPEFLAVGSTAQTIEKSVAALDRLIVDGQERKRQRDELLSVSASVAQTGASRRAARTILQRLGIPEAVDAPTQRNVTKHAA